MKKILVISLVLVSLSFLFVASAFAAKPTSTGFDQYGYNNTARNFVGTGWSWCQAYAEKHGTPTLTIETCESWLGGQFTNDKLVMKWNKAWDDCNTDPENDNVDLCLGAWTDNEWNGMNGGSGAVWHYKIIWVGSDKGNNHYWLPGGYSIWGNYEVVMDQGTDKSGAYSEIECLDGSLNNGGHAICALATPNGYGAVLSH